MLVAKYWADARLQHKFSNRKQKNSQVTLRRLGWSNDSQEAAEALAQQRLNNAILQVKQRISDNPSITLDDEIIRQEHDVGYNGADGIPIREEIIQMYNDDLVITRNIYGSLCLNTSNVMFIDIDDNYRITDESTFSFNHLKILKILSVLFNVIFFSTFIYRFSTIIYRYLNPYCKSDSNLIMLIIGGILLIIGGILFIFFVFMVATFLAVLLVALLDSTVNFLYTKIHPPLKRISTFAQTHPQWTMKIYRTAAGYRILVLHQKFDPTDKKMWEDFKKLGIDSTYQRMCQLQKCFRARLTPKPWRIGIKNKIIEKGSGVWHAHFAHDLKRLQWINNYEQLAQKYSTCHFIKQYGPDIKEDDIDPEIKAVMQIHDQMCKVGHQLPLA